jgi:hypothetical protein
LLFSGFGLERLVPTVRDTGSTAGASPNIDDRPFSAEAIGPFAFQAQG